MHAKKLLHNFLRKHDSHIHQYRLDSLIACCEALLVGQRLTVTDIGRSISSNTSPKHNIKRADRLLGNHHLHAEAFSLYASIAQVLAGAARAPVILIDWSDLTSTRTHFLLRASLAVDGRPVTLYEEVHTQLDNRATHQQFLRQLKRLLPERCKPIIVTDAGFRSSWFIAVAAMGWDWVGRIRGRILCARDSDMHWIPCKSFMAQATRKIKDMPRMRVIRNHNIGCRLCLVRKPPKGRYQANIDGSRRARRKSREHAISAREPWLIATSLTRCAAKTVIRYYALRMQIEEGFRDIKNSRFGLCLRFCGTRQTERLTILLLIAHIAYIILYATGVAAEARRMQFGLQSNSTRHRRVLSLPYLACLLIRTNQHGNLPLQEIDDAIQIIAERIANPRF